MEENAEFKKRKIEEHYALLNRLTEEKSRMKRTMWETEHAKKMEIYEMYQSELKVICLIPIVFFLFSLLYMKIGNFPFYFYSQESFLYTYCRYFPSSSSLLHKDAC